MIRIERLNYAVGNFALRDISLQVGPGEYFVLLGPTGSGKTLLVECLCGLNRIDSGRIHIGQADVTDLEPRNRRLGYVPQDYALFPHQSVRGNVRFGLSKRLLAERGMSAEAADLMEKVVMDVVGISHLADRSPRKLSGGEQQRVALARALAVEPKVLLLDEPVSALDEQTRDEICRQLKQLQRNSGTTALHVCHNFAEMLAVADRVGIIDGGRILQVGTPQEILQRPNSVRVAHFIQAGNVLAARAETNGRWIALTCEGDVRLHAPVPDSGPVDGEVTVMVRPENIRLEPDRPENTPPGTMVLEGAVSSVVDLGPVVRIHVRAAAEAELVVSLGKREYNEHPVDVGDRMHLAVAPEDVHVMRQ